MDKHTLDVLEFEKIREIVAGYASSDLGKSVAREMRPLEDLEKVRACQQQTSEVKRLLELGERLPLGGLHDVRPLLSSIRDRGSPLEPTELLQMRDTLRAGEEIRVFCEGLGEDFPRLVSLARHFTAFPAICRAIEECVDDGARVRDTASPALSELRKKIEPLRAQIRERAHTLLQSKELRGFLQDATLQTTRNGRHVLAVRAEHWGRVAGILHDRSQSGATVFIEPQELVGLGNELDEALFEEQREVTRILWELTRKIWDRQSDIEKTISALAWFDFTYAKGRFSLAYGMHEPDVSQDGRMVLRDARHPLLMWLALRKGEDLEQSVIPMSVRLGEDFDLLIITGPNSGGKTVALKTVGLLAIMVQAGLHIPAALGSRCPVFEGVYVDVGDEQSIEQNLGTFASHMSRIVEILGKSTDRSLVLLDELGAGTDPAEGGAIGVGILDRLLRMGVRAAVTTHLGIIKGYPYQNPRAQNACVEFDEETLAPTYRLLIGQPGVSNALVIARRLGLPPEVSSRAEKVLKQAPSEGAEIIRRMQEASQTAERNRQRAEALSNEAEKLRADARERLEKLKAVQGRLAREAQEEMDRTAREIRAKLAEAEAELQQGPKSVAERTARLKAEIEEALSSTSLAEKHAEFVRKLREGEQVYLPRFDDVARIKRIDRKRGTVVVRIGNVDLETSLEEVTWAGKRWQ